jgi:plastin-1
VKNQNGKVTVGDLPPFMVKLKPFREFTEEEIRGIFRESGSDLSEEIDFESFLRVSVLCLLIFLCFLSLPPSGS